MLTNHYISNTELTLSLYRKRRNFSGVEKNCFHIIIMRFMPYISDGICIANFAYGQPIDAT